MTSFTHQPVLPNESIEGLKLFEGAVVVDGTVGLGGHSKRILERIMPGGMLLGIDRDKAALAMAKQGLGPGFMPIHGNFFDMEQLLGQRGIEQVDAILLDLGVSSYQLDDATRGFSYMEDAPLDMRMDPSGQRNAKEIVNGYDAAQLTDIISRYGEERWAKRIAEFIVKARAQKPIETTGELVTVIKNAIPAGARREGPHPAKRTFQAIRIEVNGELEGLQKAIQDAAGLLRPGGRLCIITFHSLEDRIVKQTFSQMQNPCICPPKSPICTCGREPIARVITRKPIVPSQDELEHNPRARSAKLRILERT